MSRGISAGRGREGERVSPRGKGGWSPWLSVPLVEGRIGQRGIAGSWCRLDNVPRLIRATCSCLSSPFYLVERAAGGVLSRTGLAWAPGVERAGRASPPLRVGLPPPGRCLLSCLSISPSPSPSLSLSFSSKRPAGFVRVKPRTCSTEALPVSPASPFYPRPHRDISGPTAESESPRGEGSGDR